MGPVRNPCSETQRKGGSHASGEEFILPCADGSVKLAGGCPVFRTSTITRDSPREGEEHNDVLLGVAEGSYPADQQLTGDTEVLHDLVFLGIIIIVLKPFWLKLKKPTDILFCFCVTTRFC